MDPNEEKMLDGRQKERERQKHETEFMENEDDGTLQDRDEHQEAQPEARTVSRGVGTGPPIAKLDPPRAAQLFDGLKQEIKEQFRVKLKESAEEDDMEYQDDLNEEKVGSRTRKGPKDAPARRRKSSRGASTEKTKAAKVARSASGDRRARKASGGKRGVRT